MRRFFLIGVMHQNEERTQLHVQQNNPNIGNELVQLLKIKTAILAKWG